MNDVSSMSKPDLVLISSKEMDVLLHPLQSSGLIMNAEVQSPAIVGFACISVYLHIEISLKVYLLDLEENLADPNGS